MLFSCSVSYRATLSEPLFRQFLDRVLRSSRSPVFGESYVTSLEDLIRNAFRNGWQTPLSLGWHQKKRDERGEHRAK